MFERKSARSVQFSSVQLCLWQLLLTLVANRMVNRMQLIGVVKPSIRPELTYEIERVIQAEDGHPNDCKYVSVDRKPAGRQHSAATLTFSTYSGEY
jgi:hypothetical protein